MTTLDYASLDYGRCFKYREHLMSIASEHGYNYITEAFKDLYERHGPETTSQIMGVTKTNVYQIIKYIGIEPKRKPGGNNNTKLTKEKVIKARRIWNGRVDKEYITALMTVLEVDVSCNCMRSALRGIDTWKEI